jgi:hypothetical protein
MEDALTKRHIRPLATVLALSYLCVECVERERRFQAY